MSEGFPPARAPFPVLPLPLPSQSYLCPYLSRLFRSLYVLCLCLFFCPESVYFHWCTSCGRGPLEDMPAPEVVHSGLLYAGVRFQGSSHSVGIHHTSYLYILRKRRSSLLLILEKPIPQLSKLSSKGLSQKRGFNILESPRSSRIRQSTAPWHHVPPALGTSRRNPSKKECGNWSRKQSLLQLWSHLHQLPPRLSISSVEVRFEHLHLNMILDLFFSDVFIKLRYALRLNLTSSTFSSLSSDGPSGPALMIETTMLVTYRCNRGASTPGTWSPKKMKHSEKHRKEETHAMKETVLRMEAGHHPTTHTHTQIRGPPASFVTRTARALRGA